MTRMEDMIKRYGECVTVAAAARIMGRSRRTVQRMLVTGGCGGRAPGRWWMSDRWPNTSNHRLRPIEGLGRRRIATSGEAASAYD